MKKILFSIPCFTFLFFVLLIPANACYGCRTYSHVLSYHAFDASRHCALFLGYDPSTLSSPIYSAYTIYNNSVYFIFRSETPFSGCSGYGIGSDSSCSGSSGIGEEEYKSVWVRKFDFLSASDFSMETYMNSQPFPKFIEGVNVNSTSDILNLDLSLFTLAVNADGSIFEPPTFDPAVDMHDFTKDVYNPDLAVPVLSQISYTGFKIDNPDNKEWQLVVDGRVFGLKWNPEYVDPLILTNFNYSVNRQWWNFAEHPDVVNSNGIFDVYEAYGISTYQWFLQSVQQYSTDVSPSDYPNYSFLKVGLKTGWNTFLDYINNLGADEADYQGGGGHRFEQNIYRSRMCQVTYYVRFVERDSEGNPSYSRWMAYTLKPSQEVVIDGENFSRGNVEFGEVNDVDLSTGRPIVSDKSNLKYNTETASYEYFEPGSEVNWDLSVENFQSAFSFFGEMPNLVSAVFDCYPAWMVSIIGVTISFLCAMAIYHAIRG